MKDLLLYIARNLVDDPDSVSVTEVQGDQELTLVRSYAQRTGVKVSVDIVD